MRSRSFSTKRPIREHLVRGSHGLRGEINDLRGDIDGALSSLEEELGDPVAKTQTEWYINASIGDDAADGATALTALKTFKECMARLTGQLIDHYVTVRLLTDIAEDAYIPNNVVRDGILHILGTPTVIGSGTITGAVDADFAANQQPTITDAGLPVGWDASGFTGHRLKVTGGAYIGAATWPHADLGGKTARIGIWYGILPEVQTIPVSAVFGLPSDLVGAPYNIERLNTLRSLRYVGTSCRIIVDGVYILPVALAELVPAAHNALSFVACQVANLAPGVLITTTNLCYLTSWIGYVGEDTIERWKDAVGVVEGNLVVQSGGSTQLGATLFSDCPNGPQVESGGYIEINNVGILGTSALFVHSGGRVLVLNYIWGSATGTMGIRISSDGSVSGVLWGLMSKATLAGTVTVFDVGGDNKTLAEVPYLNIGNLARVSDIL